MKTLRCPSVWRPCIYMYMSLALSVAIHEGMFYWYTDAKEGPKFSQVSPRADSFYRKLLLLLPACAGP